MSRNVAVRKPAALELGQGFHQAAEAGLVQPFEASELPQSDQHHEGRVLVVVAE